MNAQALHPLTSENSTKTNSIEFNDQEVDPADVDMQASGVNDLVDVFNRQVSDGLHYGAQLVVLRHGKVVLDRAAGVANLKRGTRVTPETPFHCFSVTKPFTGVCIHRMIEQGKIEMDAPVAEYWPEFGCKGKETATIRHVFLHQAGIPSRGIRAQIPLWANWNLVTRNVASLEAEFVPGSKTSYHAVNYGFIMGEVFRRVAGRPIQEYMQEEIFTPLTMQHSYLGLPWKLQKHAARIYSGDSEQDQIVFVFNLPFIRGAVMPAASLNSTARDVAVFYQMLLNQGYYANRQFLKPETIDAATAIGYEGFDEYINDQMRWGYGFHLGGLNKPGEPAGGGMGYKSSINTFGHFGQNSIMAWADKKYDLAVCLTTNRLLKSDANNARFKAISDAVWNAVQ